jgi:hypothetical protein
LTTAARIAPVEGALKYAVMTIRWEEQDNGDWHGLSGELIVALVVPDPAGRKRWLWEVTVQRPPGWRNEGHRTSALAARRAVDDYWARWCGAAALKPDIERLVAGSDEVKPADERRKRRR